MKTPGKPREIRSSGAPTVKPDGARDGTTRMNMWRNDPNRINRPTAPITGCGGHGMMAGGKIELSGMSKSAVNKLENELKMRFLEVLKVPDRRGTALFPKVGSSSGN